LLLEASMKRNLNLVREVLLRVEPLPVHVGKGVVLKVGEPPFDVPGFGKEEIAYHIRIMTEGGLLSTAGFQSDGETMPDFRGLTWRGHEFLDDIRNPEAWKYTMARIEKYGGAGMTVAWELAKAYMRIHGLPM